MPTQSERGRRKTEPRYFFLLWEHELDELQSLLAEIARRLDEVVDRWHTLYEIHIADSRVLSEPEFVRIFRDELTAITRALSRKDMNRYAAEVRRIGVELAERRVPIRNLIALAHLLEQAVQPLFPADPVRALESFMLFDKLNHIHCSILIEAYFDTCSIERGHRIAALERQAKLLPTGSRNIFHGLVGASPAMRKLYELIEAVSKTLGTVLVVGESGTGKELVAHAIHDAGPRAAHPFIALNCAAIPRELLESELFGYRRGAFSGANSDFAGMFRAADGGTLFLDEITEMNLHTQSKLLRALQERSVRPVGATKEVAVDIRVIASTNRDPHEALRAGHLREDLFYRIQSSIIEVPPLRDRLDDVPMLAWHYIALLNEKLNRLVPVCALDDEALEAMRRYMWPGNVRELGNAIESAMTFTRADTIRLEDLPASVRGTRTSPDRPAASQIGADVGSFSDAEREIIRRALANAGGNRARAARVLQISRKRLYAKIAKYGLAGDTARDSTRARQR